MKRTVRLALTKETLASLTPDDMQVVAGGVAASSPTCYTCLDCVDVSQSYIVVTNCCATVPTFHGGC